MTLRPDATGPGLHKGVSVPPARPACSSPSAGGFRRGRRAPCGQASSPPAWGCRRTDRPPRQGMICAAGARSASAACRQASCRPCRPSGSPSPASSARMTKISCRSPSRSPSSLTALRCALTGSGHSRFSSDRCMACVLAALRRSWKSSASPRSAACFSALRALCRATRAPSASTSAACSGSPGSTSASILPSPARHDAAAPSARASSAPSFVQQPVAPRLQRRPHVAKASAAACSGKLLARRSIVSISAAASRGPARLAAMSR